MEQRNTHRVFDTGATRDTDAGKLDFDGFLSPLAMERFAQYMHMCRHLPDGTLRDSDNWQKGIPFDTYRKSLWRHFFDAWKRARAADYGMDMETELCAILFNTQGMLHEIVKARLAA